MVECRVVDGEYPEYEEIKEAYLNGIRGAKLREKFGIGTSAYKTLLKEFREDGIIIAQKGRVKVGNTPKYYYRASFGEHTYWVVRRTINWKVYNFGYFKSKAEAQQKVKELEENGWEGLL